MILCGKSVYCAARCHAQHELHVVDDDVSDVIDVDCVPHGVKHFAGVVSAVEGEVVHGQALEAVGPRVKLVEVLLDVELRELLKLHLCQTSVVHLEAAPQGRNSLKEVMILTLVFSGVEFYGR